jgi:hypothetical protein
MHGMNITIKEHKALTLSDPMSDLFRHYDFPVPDAFLDFNPFQSNFLPPAYSPALIYFWRERGWWVTFNYPTVLKEENINVKSTT